MRCTNTTTGPTVPTHPLPYPSVPGPSGKGSRDAGAASVADQRYHDPAVAVTPLEDPCTVRERLGWQLRTARVLVGLLPWAMGDGLPRIAWTVSHAGASLIGHCYGHTAGQRRGQFQAWYAAVGATPGPGPTTPGGTVHLRAVALNYDGLVDVVVLADIYADDQAGDQQ